MKDSIVFKDSFKLLPSSLRKLSESFKVLSPKGIFPILFSDVNFKGQVPQFEYFKNVTLELYNKYVKEWGNKEWSFKRESINYCKLDCISLHQVLTEFNQLIFNKFKINISKYPPGGTLSSLAFAIYRSHYLNKEIHGLTGCTYFDIALGYKGGAVDMYIPRNPKGTKIYAYDVNSLYPNVMKEYLYPIGSPTYFKGDVLKMIQMLLDSFGVELYLPPAGTNNYYILYYLHITTTAL
jgi:DNA polymerase type B, organellar and viral